MSKKTNLIAVVTGAAGGIGQATSLRFVEAGYRVILIDLNEAALKDFIDNPLKNRKACVDYFTADISDRKAMEESIDQIFNRYGKIDTLVNSAGIFFSASFVDLSDEQWNRMLQINLTSIFILSQLVISRWREINTKGCIVNIGSTSGAAPNPGASHYCVAKAGVEALTRSLALEYAQFKIRVNSVAPGFVRTPLTEPEIQKEGKLRTWEDAIPFGRLGKPEEIAEAVFFMASDAAGYITGQTLYVDGGYLLKN